MADLIVLSIVIFSVIFGILFGLLIAFVRNKLIRRKMKKDEKLPDLIWKEKIKTIEENNARRRSAGKLETTEQRIVKTERRSDEVKREDLGNAGKESDERDSERHFGVQISSRRSILRD